MTFKSSDDFSFRGVKVVSCASCPQKCEDIRKRDAVSMKDKVSSKFTELEGIDVSSDTDSFRASFLVANTKRVVDVVYEPFFLDRYNLRKPQLLLLFSDGVQEMTYCELKYLAEHLKRLERCISMHIMNASREAEEETWEEK